MRVSRLPWLDCRIGTDSLDGVGAEGKGLAVAFKGWCVVWPQGFLASVSAENLKQKEIPHLPTQCTCHAASHGGILLIFQEWILEAASIY